MERMSHAERGPEVNSELPVVQRRQLTEAQQRMLGRTAANPVVAAPTPERTQRLQRALGERAVSVDSPKPARNRSRER